MTNPHIISLLTAITTDLKVLLREAGRDAGLVDGLELAEVLEELESRLQEVLASEDPELAIHKAIPPDPATMDALTAYLQNKVPPGSTPETMNRAKLEFLLHHHLTGTVPGLQAIVARLQAVEDLEPMVAGLVTSQEALETGLDQLTRSLGVEIATVRNRVREEASKLDKLTATMGEPMAHLSNVVSRMDALEAGRETEVVALLTRVDRRTDQALHDNARELAKSAVAAAVQAQAQALLARVAKVEGVTSKLEAAMESMSRRHDRLTKRMDKERPAHLQPESLEQRIMMAEERLARLEGAAPTSKVRLEDLETRVANMDHTKATTGRLSQTTARVTELERDLKAGLLSRAERMDQVELELGEAKARLARLEGGRGEAHLAPPPAEPDAVSRRPEPTDADMDRVVDVLHRHVLQEDRDPGREMDAMAEARGRDLLPLQDVPVITVAQVDTADLVHRVANILRLTREHPDDDRAEAIVDHILTVKRRTCGPSRPFAGPGHGGEFPPQDGPTLAPGRPQEARSQPQATRPGPWERPSTGLSGPKAAKLSGKLRSLASSITGGLALPTAATELGWLADQVDHLASEAETTRPPAGMVALAAQRLRELAHLLELHPVRPEDVAADMEELAAKLEQEVTWCELEAKGLVRRTGYLPDHPNSPESRARRATLEEVRDHVMERMGDGFTNLEEAVDILEAMMEDHPPAPEPPHGEGMEDLLAQLRAVAAGKGRRDMATLFINVEELEELADRMEARWRMVASEAPVEPEPMTSAEAPVKDGRTGKVIGKLTPQPEPGVPEWFRSLYTKHMTMEVPVASSVTWLRCGLVRELADLASPDGAPRTDQEAEALLEEATLTMAMRRRTRPRARVTETDVLALVDRVMAHVVEGAQLPDELVLPHRVEALLEVRDTLVKILEDKPEEERSPFELGVARAINTVEAHVRANGGEVSCE